MLKNIPKVLHLYWGKNNPLTFLQYLTVVSFRDHHPNWVIKVYYPVKSSNNISWNNNEQKLKIISKDYFDKLNEFGVEKIEVDFNKIGFNNNYSEVIKSDFFRYYILYKEGGIWSDFDIIYLKSLNNINFNLFTCYNISSNNTFIIHNSRNNYSIGFIGSSPKNKITKILYENCLKNLNVLYYQSIGYVYIKNMLGTPKECANKNKDINLIILPEYFYLPVHFSQIYVFFDKNKNMEISENTVGIHWYNGHYLSRNFENDLEKQNMIDSNLWVYIEKYLKYKVL